MNFRTVSFSFRLAAHLAAILLMVFTASAQTLTVLHSLTNLPASHIYDGINPAGLLLSGGRFYGTARNGGTNGNGTIFALNTNGMGFADLLSFTNNNGGDPDAGVSLSGNTLYGVTEAGGSYGDGAVFAIQTNGAGFTILHSFTPLSSTYTNADGTEPNCSLILSGGVLYGTALIGGYSGQGNVFAVNPNTMSFTNLHNFQALFTSSIGTGTNSTGSNPGSLVLVENTLYGIANVGGTNGRGTVFAVNTNGTGFRDLYAFSATSGSPATNGDGAFPTSLSSSGNVLYGTAFIGGTKGGGTVFTINTDGTGYAVLHSFTPTSGSPATNVDGANPYGGLIS